MSPADKTSDFRELISLEENSEFLNFRFSCDNILMWPFVRHRLIQKAINQRLYSINLSEMIGPKRRKWKPGVLDQCLYWFETIRRNPFSRSGMATASDVLMCGSAAPMIKTSDGRYLNRLYDHFALEYRDKTLIVESSVGTNYFGPRVFPFVRHYDLIREIGLGVSKYAKTKTKDAQAVRRFIAFLSENIPYDFGNETWDRLRTSLECLSKLLPVLRVLYTALFKKINPKILFLEYGSLGSFCYVLKWAHAMGIRTGEFQQCAISRTLAAYHYGGRVFGSEYVQYLPRFFLTYGRRWNSAVQTPSEIVTVGNPFLMAVREEKRAASRHRDEKKIILFLSSGTIPDIEKALVLRLYEKLDHSQYEIIFRLPQVEMPFWGGGYGEIENSGIEIDSGNLYEILPVAECVVAAALLTVLYEAMVFTKKIYVMDHDGFSCQADPSVFTPFRNVDELADLVKGGVEKDYDTDSYWEPNWRENYRNFIENRIGIK